MRFLDPASPHWSEDIDDLRRLLGAPHNPCLFPPHFLKTTLPRIGGHVVVFESAGGVAAVGFVFPRGVRAGAREYTLRLHEIAPAGDAAGMARLVEAELGGAHVVPYWPDAHEAYTSDNTLLRDVAIGRPSEAEAGQIRDLQASIWGSEPDFLYPTDIHCAGAGVGTSLVARVDGEVGGFLFGFYKFDGAHLPAAWMAEHGADLQLESQLLGVLPAHRRKGIAVLLKRVQAEHARRAGIRIVNWTVDPLQFPNAVLNFGQLGAVAFDFHVDYYPFRNALNRIPASRFGITWLLDTDRVSEARAGAPASVPELSDELAEPVNDGATILSLTAEAPRIAIEVPADWTALQHESKDQALAWRHASDRIFRAYLGCCAGQYMVTGVAKAGPRRYLLAERVTEELVLRLGSVAGRGENR